MHTYVYEPLYVDKYMGLCVCMYACVSLYIYIVFYKKKTLNVPNVNGGYCWVVELQVLRVLFVSFLYVSIFPIDKMF